MKVVYVLVISGLLLLMNGVVYAEQGAGKPGDNFRKTAADYEASAAKAVNAATNTKGEDVNRYLELSTVYQEMAQIKRRAAEKADQGRWNDMKWDRYHQLESRRDQLLGQLDWSQTKKQVTSLEKSGPDSLLKASSECESNAQQARGNAQDASGPEKQMFLELAKIYDEMAKIKRDAAVAAKRGKSYKWAHFRTLEHRRDELKNQLNQTRYGR